MSMVQLGILQIFTKNIKIYDNPVVMAEDFNLVLNQEMDTYNYTSLNNPRSRNVVLEMIIQNSLIDVWWEMNVEKREYTWYMV